MGKNTCQRPGRGGWHTPGQPPAHAHGWTAPPSLPRVHPGNTAPAHAPRHVAPTHRPEPPPSRMRHRCRRTESLTGPQLWATDHPPPLPAFCHMSSEWEPPAHSPTAPPTHPCTLTHIQGTHLVSHTLGDRHHGRSHTVTLSHLQPHPRARTPQVVTHTHPSK